MSGNLGDDVKHAILVENLYFSYDETEVLRGVNLRVGRGEIVFIMGANGAGKTTLVKHLNGLLKPKRGRVVVWGMDTRDHSVAELSRVVGFVFQNPDHQLFAESVREEIEFGLRNIGLDEEEIERRVKEVVKRFELEDLEEKPPFTLSGGEKKRLTIASVIAMNPKIVVLDEPTMGQDYRQKLNLRRMIEEIVKEGRTVVIVTHDVEFASEIKGKVVVLDDGRVVAEGTRETVFTDREVLMKASLSPPQLVEIADKIGLRFRWFESVEELGEHILECLR